MPKRELHQYEYTCDGYTRGGQRCPGRDVVTVTDPTAADAAIAELRDWTTAGRAWIHTARGWLCQRPHRDDPRPWKGSGGHE